MTVYRGRILEWNPDNSLSSPPCYSQSSHNSFSLGFYFVKLTQPLTVSLNDKGGKPDRKPYLLPYGFKKSIQKPQVWELSRLCSETQRTLYVHEFGFTIVFGIRIWPIFLRNLLGLLVKTYFLVAQNICGFVLGLGGKCPFPFSQKLFFTNRNFLENFSMKRNIFCAHSPWA